ncbi:hypothetical protein, partial [Paenarthrobacter aurescens]|uniref:hypothetical protein n=1 Tax=Paenarthrobacter aurescens TaxID=43663 RepID=UPI001C3F702E
RPRPNTPHAQTRPTPKHAPRPNTPQQQRLGKLQQYDDGWLPLGGDRPPSGVKRALAGVSSPDAACRGLLE